MTSNLHSPFRRTLLGLALAACFAVPQAARAETLSAAYMPGGAIISAAISAVRAILSAATGSSSGVASSSGA